ncbi:MAG: hypothetical protein WC479_00820 [Candidatus Izemoplasmatales bacterium]
MEEYFRIYRWTVTLPNQVIVWYSTKLPYFPEEEQSVQFTEGAHGSIVELRIPRNFSVSYLVKCLNGYSVPEYYEGVVGKMVDRRWVPAVQPVVVPNKLPTSEEVFVAFMNGEFNND